jgi:predicted nucleic acid-binding protein
VKRFVLDCSVSGAWCLKDDNSAKADRYLQILRTGQAVVPSLWVAEMVNVLLTAERRRRIDGADVELAIQLLNQLPIFVESQETGSMVNVYRLALQHRLSAYDACYLELARRHRLPLASMDRELRAAAKSAKVRLL